MEFKDSYLGATFHIQWFCRSCEPWWMMSLFGPLGKATKSCCLKRSGEETLCLEKFQLQPRQPPTISASVQHQKSQLEQHSLSARLDGGSSDPASPPPQVSRSLPTPDSGRSPGEAKAPEGLSAGSLPVSPAHMCSPEQLSLAAGCSRNLHPWAGTERQCHSNSTEGQGWGSHISTKLWISLEPSQEITVNLIRQRFSLAIAAVLPCM